MPEFLRRLSIRDKKFSELTGGNEIIISHENFRDIVIINAAPISRSYYEDNYDPDKIAIPICWSADTQKPSEDVPDDKRQAARCMDCTHNIRGSGYGSSRACRFSQRLAVVMEGQLDVVYQLRLPATSIFGESKDGNMPMQAYARFLRNHNTPAVAVVTQIYFDTNSGTPKLFFKPNRPLEDEELKMVSKMIDHPDTIKCITLDFTPLFESTRTSPFESTDGFQFDKQEMSHG